MGCIHADVKVVDKFLLVSLVNLGSNLNEGYLKTSVTSMHSDVCVYLNKRSKGIHSDFGK